MTSLTPFLINLLATVATIVAIVYAYFRWSYQYWKKRGVPYLEPRAPFGSFWSPRIRSLSIGDACVEVYQQVKARGWKHCGLYIFARPNYFVADLELVKHILVKDFQYFTDRGFYTNDRDDPLRSHLFAIGGSKWRNLRAKLSPTFTSGKMKGMFKILEDCGCALERYVEENVEGKGAVDVKEILACFSTDVIGSCAFGIDCNSFKEPNSPFRTYGKEIFIKSSYDKLKTAFCLSFPDIARGLRMRLTSKDVNDFFIKIVEDTVTYREKNNFVRNDFMQLLIDMKNNNGGQGDGTSLTMNELAAQCFVFFVAGFETSSTTMALALFELATHPRIQDKVRNEINTVLAKHDDQMTYDSLSELKYLEQVIAETLRLYPPFPFITRVCVRDYKVPGEDVIIEKGIGVIIPIKGIHCDEKYYRNPREFDPEWFNEENRKKRHRFAHIPFGEGPRICIGERFGIMQTKVGLACLLRKFRFTLNERTKVPLQMSKRSFVSSADGGIWLNIEKI